MDSMDSMGSMSSMMPMGFQNSHTTPLYSSDWVPSSTAGYAGTCIFLICLAAITRGLFAVKAILEQNWRNQAFQRRYVTVQGRNTEEARINANLEAKSGTLLTAQGIEENVKVIRADGRKVIPFRLSVDVPRAALVLLIAGTSYLLYVHLLQGSSPIC